jgi:hypothetical protein
MAMARRRRQVPTNRVVARARRAAADLVNAVTTRQRRVRIPAAFAAMA